MLGAGRIGLAVALNASSRDARTSEAVTLKQQHAERKVRLLGNLMPKGLGNEPHLEGIQTSGSYVSENIPHFRYKNELANV
jgi:hypothetical protein